MLHLAQACVGKSSFLMQMYNFEFDYPTFFLFNFRVVGGGKKSAEPPFVGEARPIDLWRQMCMLLFVNEFHAAADEGCEVLALEHSARQKRQIHQLFHQHIPSSLLLQQIGALTLEGGDFAL